jgi:hypothetical protein
MSLLVEKSNARTFPMKLSTVNFSHAAAFFIGNCLDCMQLNGVDAPIHMGNGQARQAYQVIGLTQYPPSQ